MENFFSDKARLNYFLGWSDFKLSCVYVIHTVDNTPPEHQHIDFYEMVIVKSGNAKHLCNGQIHEISPGSIFLVAPKDKHTFLESQNLGIYNVLFDKSFFRYFQPDLTCLSGFQLLFNLQPDSSNPRDGIKVEDEYFPAIIRLAETMIEEQKLHNHEDHGGQTALLISFLEIVLLLSRHSHWISGNDKLSHIQSLSCLVAALDKYYASDWTLDKMAKMAKMSVSGFRQEFKLLTGKSPIDYLLNLRLEKSYILLHLPQYRVIDVAIKCGFGDSNYFTRQFKRRFGITPRILKTNPCK